MNDTDLALAQLLCTRLCHDLAGPIGAVAAGVELIGGDPSAADAETLGLIEASSAAASFKLKFIRTVLGAANGATTDMEALLEGYLTATAGADGKPKLTWPAPAAFESLAAAAGPHWRQTVLNLCLTALEMQPGCRELTIAVSGTTNAAPVKVEVTAKGQPPRTLRPELPAAFAGQTAPGDLSAKTVQAYLAGRMVRAAGGTVDATQRDGVTAVTARF